MKIHDFDDALGYTDVFFSLSFCKAFIRINNKRRGEEKGGWYQKNKLRKALHQGT